MFLFRLALRAFGDLLSLFEQRKWVALSENEKTPLKRKIMIGKAAG